MTILRLASAFKSRLLTCVSEYCCMPVQRGQGDGASNISLKSNVCPSLMVSLRTVVRCDLIRLRDIPHADELQAPEGIVHGAGRELLGTILRDSLELRTVQVG